MLAIRCKVPSCDLSDPPEFKPDWLQYAVPYEDGQPSWCHKYPVREDALEKCSNTSFDRTGNGERCEEFVFKTAEHRIANEVSKAQQPGTSFAV